MTLQPYSNMLKFIRDCFAWIYNKSLWLIFGRFKPLNFKHVDISGTYFQGYYDSPWSFEETVARLLTLSGQPLYDDGYKSCVDFTGTFKNKIFTLYDYKEDGEIHIGGKSNLDVEGLSEALDAALAAVEPTPFTKQANYDKKPVYKFPQTENNK